MTLDPDLMSLPQLTAVLRSGELPLLTYLEELLQHYRQVEPDVKAFMPEQSRFLRLDKEAETLLKKFPNPKTRPPLFGVPIGVKDIFHVDRFATQAGSRLPLEILQGSESDAVSALRDAGALIMGKTVTTEFAYFAPGPTRNPHNLAHTPGGSSSGSAAAVAAGLTPFAFGTQTIGSVNRPAAFCGVVGFKPSFDRISKEGVIPLSESLDHVGGFTSDVGGMQIVARLLCADWDDTAVTNSQPVLGIPEGPYLARMSEAGMVHFRQVCRQLSEAGFDLIPVPTMPDFDDIVERHNLIVAAEAARFHQKWFAKYSDLYHAKTAELIKRGLEISNEALAEAVNGRAQLRGELTNQMFAHGLDVWISPPALGAAPPGLDSTGDPVMNLPWTHSGLPTITIPAGHDEIGMPLGLQCTGHWYADEELLDFAEQIEYVLANAGSQ